MREKRFLLLLGIFLALAILFTISQPQQDIISTDKYNYTINDTITIKLNYTDFNNTKLEILNKQHTYNFFNPQQLIKFLPKEYGLHIIQFFKNSNLLDTAQFNVINPEPKLEAQDKVIEPTITKIFTDKNEYNLSEIVTIIIETEEDLSLFTLEITNIKTYKFFNLKSHNIKFLPSLPGDYDVVLKKDKDVIADTSFIVTNAIEKFFISPSKKPNFKILNRRNLSLKLKSLKQTLPNKLTVEIEDSPVKKIEFTNLALDNATLKIDNINKKFKINNKDIVNSYAIDPTQLSFDNATVTVTARGIELWKCKDWDFNQQLCQGSWVKLQDITPGKNYTFLLNAQDPGFAETGVATVNTKKPIYHPYETVDIIMVVLDEQGYLRDANVQLTVTNPNNITYNVPTFRTSKGIYESTFSNTAIEGNYILFVNASGNNVNSSLTSNFLVQNYYEFDILRNTPVTIDPFKGPFESSIRIFSYNYTGNFNFTEVLPINFTVYEATGAILTSDTDNIYLTWTNLQNNSIVNYTANSPLSTPYLYVLGPSFIVYNTIFTEARPWYLAVDPTYYGIHFTGFEADTTAPWDGWSDPGADAQRSTVRSYCTDTACGGGGAASIEVQDNDATGSYTAQTFDLSAPCGGVACDSLTLSLYVYPNSYDNADEGFDIWCDYGTGSAFELADWKDSGTAGRTICGVEAPENTWTKVECDLTQCTLDGAVEIRITSQDSTSGGNNDQVFIDGINITGIRNIPPNVTALVYPGNGNSVSEGVVDFNFTVEDVDSTIQNCTLYNNFTGDWEADRTITSISETAVNSISVTAPAGVYIWNVLCFDDEGKSDWYTSNYTVIVDSAPVLTNFLIEPTLESITRDINISINVTDDYSVTVIAQITLPNTSQYNYTMTDADSDDIYNLTFTGTSIAGLYNVTIYVNDSYGHINDSNKGNFTINLENLSITTDKQNYVADEIVYIYGRGFNPFVNVTVNITDSTGDPALDTSVISNSTGGINLSWTVPSSPALGIYKIGANDTTDYSLSINNTFEVVSAIITADKGSYEQAEIVYISGSVWDPGYEVTVNITDPNGIEVFGPINYTANASGNINATWALPINESLGSHILMAYEPDSPTKKDDYVFTVTARTVTITTQYPWYKESEQVNITGYGFSYNNNVTINIYNATGQSISGYPRDVVSNSTGGINDSFTVNNLVSGTYNIIANDTLYPALGDTTIFEIVRARIYTDKQTYDNGETVTIYGQYWDRLVNVTIDVINETGLSEAGYPQDVITNNNGEFIHQLTARAIGLLATVFNVTAAQLLDSSENASTNYTVLRQAVIDTDKPYYPIQTNANITGQQYSPDDYVTLWVKSRDNGGTALTYPRSIATDSLGEFNHLFNTSNYCGGNYTVIGTDQTYPLLLNATANFTITNWWDSAWEKRKPLSIIEPDGVARTNTILEVNITGLTGFISDCDELRIIDYLYNHDGIVLESSLYGGDDSSFCTVRFYANISANEITSTRIYAYYNNSAASPLSTSMPFNEVIHQDNGENATLRNTWTDDPFGTDTATSGWWAWDNPELYGDPAQPEDDVSDPGIYALFTGPTGDNTGTGYQGDVDGGNTSVTSGTIDISGWRSANLSFYRWYYSNDNGANNDDTCAMYASTNNGTTWPFTIFVLNDDDIGGDPDGYNQWDQTEFVLENIINNFTSEFRLLGLGEDFGDGDIVECGFDEFVITAYVSNINVTVGASEDDYVCQDVDYSKPVVKDLNVNPDPQQIGYAVNITVNATDDYYVGVVKARITMPNSTIFELVMNDTDSDNVYNVTYFSTLKLGLYNVTILANDSVRNSNYTTKTSFEIVLQNLSITTDKQNYVADEVVYIYGTGFNPFVNVTVNITDPDEESALATSVISNSTGGINLTWTVPPSPILGFYIINANDTSNYSRSIDDGFEVVSAIITADKGSYEQAEIVYISGSVWDPGYEVTVNITDPNGIEVFGPINYTANASGNINATWALPINESLGSHILMAYEPDSPTKKDDYVFTVTARTVTITTQYPWYKESEQVNITGYGFSYNNNVTINIYNATGQSISGYPRDVVSNSTGGINDSFTVNNLVSGTYNIIANDTLYPALGDTTIFEIVRARIYTDKQTYDNGETVTIYGQYWDRLVNVTIDVINETGLSEAGYPQDVITNNNGEFIHQLTARAIGLLATVFNVTAAQLLDSSENASTNYTVVRTAIINTDKDNYVQLETVNITGLYYTPDDYVKVWIKSRDNGGTAIDYPKLIPTDSSGNFNHIFDTNSYCGGNYTVIGTDETHPVNLNASANFTLRDWWDSAWEKRLPIYLTNLEAQDRYNERIFVNVTGLANNISSCVDEIRVISTITGAEVPVNIVGGDNSNYCEVIFLGNITALAVNESNYYVYYNNSAASDPGYSDLELYSYAIHFTGIEADDTAPWDGWVSGGADALESNLYSAVDDSGASGGTDSIEVQDNDATGSYTAQSFDLSSACAGNSCDFFNFSVYLYPESYDNADEGFDIWCDYGTGSAYELADWKDSGPIGRTICGVEAPENTWTKVECDLSPCTIDSTTELRITSQDSTSGGNGDQVYIDGLNITGYRRSALNITSSVSNVQEYFACIPFDIIEPNVVINEPLNYYNTTDVTPEINFTITDNQDTILNYTIFVDGVYYGQNGTVNNNTPKLLNLSTLAEGVRNITVQAMDDFRNAKNNSIIIIVDLTGPITNITQPINFTNITGSSYNLAAVSSDALTAVDTVRFYYRPNDTAIWNFACSDNSEPYQCSLDISLLKDGDAYQVRAYGNDTLGNIGQNYTVYNITLDRTGPIVTITSPVNFTNITSNSYTIQTTASDALLEVDTVFFYYRENNTATWTFLGTDSSVPYRWTWNLTLLNDGDSYQVRAYGNDSLGNVGYNYTVYNITVDRTPPDINNINITPEPQKVGLTINITANISDNFKTVDYVEAQIILPNTSQINLEMRDDNSDSIYNVTFTNTLLIGTYNLTIFVNDTLGNSNTSNLINFTIIYDDLYLITDDIKYVTGETVYITGEGFNAYGNVTINIYNETGQPVNNFPRDVISNSTGGLNDSWLIPGGQPLGMYTVNATDITDSSRSIETTFEIVAAIISTLQEIYQQADMVNITGEFWDPNENVTINITDPTGVEVYGPINITSNASGFLTANWSSNYNSTIGEYILMAYQPSNPNKYDTHVFNITQRTVYLLTDYPWYKQDDTVYITGYGFSPNINVTINIYNATGQSISGYPRDVISNSTGGINDSFTVNNLVSGTYTINATDDLYKNLNNITTFDIVFATITTDKSAYINGETVYITGNYWTKNVNITIDIINETGQSIPNYPKNVTSLNDGSISDSLTAVAIGLGTTQYNITAFNPNKAEENATANYTVSRVALLNTDKTEYDKDEDINITGEFYSQNGPVEIIIRYLNNSGFGFYYPKIIYSNIDGDIQHLFNTSYLCEGEYIIEVSDLTFSSLYANTTFNVSYYEDNSTLENADNSDASGVYNVFGGSTSDTYSSNNNWQSLGSINYNSNFTAYLNYTFNISNLNADPYRIYNITFSVEYCHSGGESSPQCNQNDPHEGEVFGPQYIYLFNFSNNEWFNYTILPVNDISDSESIFEFNLSTGIPDFVQNDIIYVRYTVSFNQTGSLDDHLLIDYFDMNITYESQVERACTPLTTKSLNVQNYDDSFVIIENTKINVYNLSNAIIDTGNGTYFRYLPGDELKVKVITPFASDNLTYEIFDLNFSGSVNITSQVNENYSYSLPTLITNVTPLIAVNDSQIKFSKAQLIIPKRSLEINTILHCINYNYQTAECLQFELNETDDFEYNETNDYIKFNVTYFDAFGGGPGDTLPNLTEIRIYNVTGLANKHSGGTLIHSGLNTTFNLTGNNIYRVEFAITNEGRKWNIDAEDYAYHNGLNETWQINNTGDIWYTDGSGANYTGGIFNNGKVEWNLSLGGTYSSGESGTFYYVVNITTDITDWYSVYFVVNDTSKTSGSTDDSTYRIFDVIKPYIILNEPLQEDNLSIGYIIFNWTAVDNTNLNLSCDLLINDAINVSGITTQNNVSTTTNIEIGTSARYNWSINCTDYDGNSNISETRNFTVIAGPLDIDINISSDNSSIEINWSAAQFAESYNIYITTNYTLGFSSTPNITGITDLNWTDINGFDSNRRYYKVAAVKGDTAALSTKTVGKHTNELIPTWNLISIPFNISEWLLYDGINGRDIFTQPGNCIMSLWRYNASNQSWERTDYNGVWTPASGSENFLALEDGRGYWAEISSACNITFYGNVPVNNRSYNLETLWNMMGHYSSKDPLLQDESVMKPINVVPENSVEIILRYNTVANKFEVTVHYPGYGWWPSFNNQDFIYLNPMKGYYFDNSQLATWTHNPNIG